MKTKLFGVISVESSAHSGGRYRHVTVRIYRKGQWRDEELFSVKWQSDSGNGGEWYGARVTVEADRGYAEMLSAAATILRKHPVGDDARGWWDSLGIERRVYDGRTMELEPVDELAPPEYVRWMAKDGSGAFAMAMASNDEEDARKALLREFARLMNDKECYQSPARIAENLGKWVAAGKPVEMAYRGDNTPTVPSLEELFAPLGVKVVEEQAA